MEEAYWKMVLTDIKETSDLFLPFYKQGEYNDGFVSVEVSPDLAYNSEGTVEEVKVLNSQVDRENVLIKIPATDEGIKAIEESIGLGISINVTVSHYYVSIF